MRETISQFEKRLGLSHDTSLRSRREPIPGRDGSKTLPPAKATLKINKSKENE